MTRRFILLKDTPELKKGAILEKKDGTSQYTCLDIEKYSIHERANTVSGGSIYYFEQDVEDAPEWFKEVEQVWLTQEEKEQLEKMLKGRKTRRL